MRKIALIICILISNLLLAQNGTIRGTVIEDANGLTIIGANVVVTDPLTGTSTDLDGKFSINIEPGTYTVKVSFISFQTVTVEQVEVKADQVTLLGNIRMKSSSLALEEVVVTATATRKSEAALNTMKKKSATMMDGISAQKMALTGDGTAVEAAKRVTGVSIEGGKYIYVRGLGDRYSKVTLNQMAIPGLDPDKNSLQMDIFPTNLIDNIIVAKNFTADLPADFTGGLINVETKSFPEEKIVSASFGISYNPNMHFNDEYLTADRSNTDWLGYDNDTRTLPRIARTENIPSTFVDPDDEVNSFIRSFNPNLNAYNETSFLDYSASFTIGNQIDLNKKKKETKRNPKLGYIFSLSYKQSQTYYDDVFYGEYQLSDSTFINNLVYSDIQEGRLGSQSNLVGTLTGLAYKTKKSKYRLMYMQINNGISEASEFAIDQNPDAVGRSGYNGFADNIVYNERRIRNMLLNGKHNFKKGKLEVDWRLSPTFSKADDPDIRNTAFTYAVDTSFQAGNAGNPTRIWRELDETSINGRTDFKYKHKLNGKDATLRFGAMSTFKQREYEIFELGLQFTGGQNWERFNYNPDAVLSIENIFPNRPNGTYFQTSVINPNPNAYEAYSFNNAYYISEEFNATELLKAIIGLRIEDFTMVHTGRDIIGSLSNGRQGNVLEKEEVLRTTDLFPSINLIYSLSEDQNLRGGFSRTVARPSFKELSFAQIIDPVTNRTFNGGLFPNGTWDGDLQPTYINNIDFRWEWFMEKGQIYSVSAFYKSFENPIELVRIPLNTTGFEYQPRNVGNGQVWGLEFEATKSLEFLGKKFENLSASGNVTIVESLIDMTDAEFNARELNKRDGQTIDNERAMAGQAPYVINFGITYNNRDNGIKSGIFYNVKGPTLLIVGTGFVPDIYQEPFHNINFGFSKSLGEDKNTSIDLNVDNILNDDRESYFDSYQAAREYFTRLSPGTSVSVGISHKF